MKRSILLVIILLFFGVSNLQAQHKVSEELKQIFQKKDSLIFDEGFNNCNLKLLETQLTNDLEFYHDIGGFQNKEEFLEAMEKNICGNPTRTYQRKLVPESVELYPLYNNGELYGMIHRGKHEFFVKEKNSHTKFTKTGSALFSSLWIKIDGKWLLKRTYSYHHGPN